MIYTIGHKENYESYFAEQGTPQKLGRELGYDGGSVWLTEEEARKECPANYDVYGVLANWYTDTAISSEEGATWHDLLKTSDLVKLRNNGTQDRKFDSTDARRCAVGKVSNFYGYDDSH